MQKSAFFLAALIASTGAMAASANSEQAGVKAVPYSYGMGLDAAKVISVVEAPHDYCQPVNTRMTYRDSQGVLHAIDYVKNDSSCEW